MSTLMTRRFLPSGRVRYFPNSEYLPDGRVVSRFRPGAIQVRSRRKLIDTTYLEGTIPATSPPPFELADGTECIPAGAIARVAQRVEHFTIIGAGKTALDTCVWLLEQGTPADAIRWIKPPRGLVAESPLPAAARSAARQPSRHGDPLEAMAQASTVADLFAATGSRRILPAHRSDVTPTMLRGAVISEAEQALLRQIRDVVRPAMCAGSSAIRSFWTRAAWRPARTRCTCIARRADCRDRRCARSSKRGG
ncbi:MAG: hypothetical protein R3E70_12920 [Burkholderiaceae bacterium]